jgi:hypothetical protein
MPSRKPKPPAWLENRWDKRELFVDSLDGRVKIRLTYQGRTVSIGLARETEAAAYLASRNKT